MSKYETEPVCANDLLKKNKKQTQTIICDYISQKSNTTLSCNKNYGLSAIKKKK